MAVAVMRNSHERLSDVIGKVGVPVGPQPARHCSPKPMRRGLATVAAMATGRQRSHNQAVLSASVMVCALWAGLAEAARPLPRRPRNRACTC